MSTKLILFGLVLFAIPIHAMKRSYSKFKQELIDAKDTRISDTKNIIIPDIDNILAYHALQFPLAEKPKDATKTINALARTNKNLNKFINDPDNNKKIVNNLASQLYCSHETIARMLWTQQSKELLKLQYDLKKLCCSTYIFSQAGDRTTLTTQKFDELITQKVDLAFTYNHLHMQKTPLMLAASDDDNPMFDLLITKGVNINNSTHHGITLLKMLITFPILADQLFYFIKLIELPELDINQQNKHGETALLRCLIRRKFTTTSEVFISVVEKLLEAGADPEIANKYGMTPLIVAKKKLKNERIMSLIKQAIERKHSTS